MRRYLTRGVDRLDDWLATRSLGRARERPALLAFLFHSVFESVEEIATQRTWPAQPLQAAELSRFIKHFLAHGYRFVAPSDIAAGLDPCGYYAWLTFDDGYANNLRALPILRALSVPATFFISSRHVAEGKAFWWDVVFRERRRSGTPVAAIRREITTLKRMGVGAAEVQVLRTFGAAALQPLSDTDRPFTPDELRGFAAHPLVTLGNHTSDHVDLTRCAAQQVRSMTREGQEYLASLTGATPIAIAYPYGRYDRKTIAAVSAEGLQLGVTTHPHKNQLPLSAATAWTIGRAFVPCGPALLAACERCRSDVQLRRWLS